MMPEGLRAENAASIPCADVLDAYMVEIHT